MKEVLETIVKELKEIKILLKRQVALFEKYDTDLFEDDEIKREQQFEDGHRKVGQSHS